MEINKMSLWLKLAFLFQILALLMPVLALIFGWPVEKE